MRARHNDRPNRVRYPADRLFTSSCSPPFLSKTQLLSVNRCRSTYVGTFTLPIKRLRRRTSAALRAEAKQPEQARGLRREARGNSQTAGKLWCDHQQVSNDHDACSSTRKISVLAQQATEVLRLQLRPQCKLQKSCGRAKEPVVHRIPARKGAECELDVAFSQRAEDGSRCRDVFEERPNAHAPRDGQDRGVVPRSVDRSASARRCGRTASKSVGTRRIWPCCKQHGSECARSCVRVINTSNRSHAPRVEDAPDPASDPWCRHRPFGAGARGGRRLLPLCRPAGPENPSSHRESLTKTGAISKPELQQIYPRWLYA